MSMMRESIGRSRPSPAPPLQPDRGGFPELAPPLHRRFRDTQTGEECDRLLAFRPGRGLDPGGLSDLLAHGYQAGRRTPILGVERIVAPWQLPAPDPHPAELATEGERAERLWSLLLSSVRDAVPDGARARVSLSGGLDSRAVAAAAATLGLAGLRASTFGDSDCADILVARQVASALELDHEVAVLASDSALLAEDRVWHATHGTGGPESAPGAATDLGWAEGFDVLLSGTSGDVIWGDTQRPGPSPTCRLERLGLPYQEPLWSAELPPAPRWASAGGSLAWSNLWTRQQGGTWNGVLPRLAYCPVVPVPWSEALLAFCLALGDEDRRDRRLLRYMLRREVPAVSDLAIAPVRGAPVHELNRAWRESESWKEALDTWVEGPRDSAVDRAFERVGLKRREVRRLVRQVLASKRPRAPFLARVRAVWRWGL